MTTEQLVTILGAVAAVLAAVGKILYELRQYQHAVNSRLDQLLDVTRTSARAEGVLSAGQPDVGSSPTTNTDVP